MITCHNCTFYNISTERHVNDIYEVVHRFTNIVVSILPCNKALVYMHSVIYNQLFPEAYRPMLRYAWQNAGYDIGEPVDNSQMYLRGVQH